MWRGIVTWAVIVVAVAAATAAPVREAKATPFVVDVVDEQTGRGVPLVELRTTSAVTFVTDSAGTVAIDEPSLNGHKVHFTLFSFGYEFPADAFGVRGTTLEVKPG